MSLPGQDFQSVVREKPEARVVSVNVGEPRDVLWHGRTVSTGIWKSPVQGHVPVWHDNLDGDRQADLRVHGGYDKAVYAYSTEDYEWWASSTGSEFGPGTFGENLTTVGVDLSKAIIGEVWVIGTARVQVTQPRLPCFKLGIRMNDATFVDRFDEVGRYGIYFRILSEGAVEGGDAIKIESRPEHGFAAVGLVGMQVSPDPDQLRRVIEIEALPAVWRQWGARQLRRAAPQ